MGVINLLSKIENSYLVSYLNDVGLIFCTVVNLKIICIFL